MAYSRWGESYWYTYWCVKLNGEVETRDNATFEICAVTRFSAKDLRDDLEGCVAQAIHSCHKFPNQPDESEIDDLRHYMREFLEEVDEQYPTCEQSLQVADEATETRGTE